MTNARRHASADEPLRPGSARKKSAYVVIVVAWRWETHPPFTLKVPNT